MKIIKKYNLEIVVFFCGAIVMVYEMVGSRVIGPYVGISTYVWTSLIGVILASLSAGYYFGGNLADKKPQVKPLVIFILCASISISLATVIKDFVAIKLSSASFSLEIKALLLSIILFAPASFFLGTVSPYAVKLKILSLENAGKTAGNLYALSTLGSIIGTFMAGFYIIPHLGSTTSLFLISFLLIILPTLILKKTDLEIKTLLSFLVSIVIFAICIFLSSAIKISILEDKDTEYNKIWVYESTYPYPNGKKTINLMNDPIGTQSAMYIDEPTEIVFDYLKFYNLYEHFKTNTKETLMIGGAAYTYPTHFLDKNKKANMDVVEIDPGMTEIAKKYFQLKDSPRLSIFHEDGRIFLNNNKKKYDVIFLDAYNSALSVPFHLTTIETVKKIYDSLSDDGVVMANVISSINGEKGKFLRAEYKTFKKMFPQILLFPTSDQKDESMAQNIMLIAFKSDKKASLTSKDQKISAMLSKVYTGEIIDDAPILTDDYAPVEHYRKSMLKKS